MAVKKILIIDDDTALNSLLSRLLVNEGYEVVSVTNGVQGSRAIIREAPHLVILDISMPLIDGFEVCQSIKRRMGMNSPKILMISVNYSTDEEGMPHALTAGAEDFMAKPLNMPKLVQRVKNLLGEL